MTTEACGVSTYRGRAFLYVLLTAGPEDLLKVGLTHHPLQRWSSFHPRWFKAFDLDHSLLIETETRGDAQALETSLHRHLVAHRCPMPLTMFAGAGGVTEWYRGAYSKARGFALECERNGYLVHQRSRDWLASAMAEDLASVDGLVREASERLCAGLLTPCQLDHLRARLEAHAEFGADLGALLPPEARDAFNL